MFPPVEIFVTGEPKGQPRPRAFARNGMVRMYNPGTAENWKSCIADEWRRSAPKMPKIIEPVSLTLCFFMPRPKSHFNSKGEIKASAPFWHPFKPDTDNFCKAVMDCLTQLGVYNDDCQVVTLKSLKQYAYTDQAAGCRIILRSAELFDIWETKPAPAANAPAELFNLNL